MPPRLPKIEKEDAPDRDPTSDANDSAEETIEISVVERPPLPKLSSGDPVRIKVEAPEVPPDREKVRYWLGTTSNSPIQNVVVGGISFPQFTGALVIGEDGVERPPDTLGAVVELSDLEVKLILERLPNLFVRIVGKGRAYVVSKAQRNFVPRAGDVALAKFLYLVKLGDAPAFGWRSQTPTPMLEE